MAVAIWFSPAVDANLFSFLTIADLLTFDVLNSAWDVTLRGGSETSMSHCDMTTFSLLTSQCRSHV